MAINYTTVFIGLKVPTLHKVVYGTSKHVLWASALDLRARLWCEDHCKGKYYPHPSYTEELFVEFEDDEDAVMFSLKFC